MGFLKSLFKSITSVEAAEKRGEWLRSYAETLGAAARSADHADEEGIIEGTSTDGIAWRLRVLQRNDRDGDSPFDFHHVLWHTDAVRLANVILVFGSHPRDVAMWGGLDGIHVRGDENLARLDAAFNELGRLASEAQSGVLPVEELVRKLSHVPADAVMTIFSQRAKRFPLPHPLSSPWHAMTIDPAAAARLLTPTVLTRLEEWRAQPWSSSSWIRAWIGGPNVRLESYLVDPGPAGYERVIEVGLGLARESNQLVGGRKP